MRTLSRTVKETWYYLVAVAVMAAAVVWGPGGTWSIVLYLGLAIALVVLLVDALFTGSSRD